MASIKTQRVIRDADGNITAGSASLIATEYLPGDRTKNHSRHQVIERLGKILWLSDDRRSGIFLSPSRGLVHYDVDDNEFEPVTTADPRIKSSVRVVQPEQHSTFGDVWLLSRFLIRTGLLPLLRSVFGKEDQYQRLLAHVFHGYLKDGSHIKCGTFIERSALGHLLDRLVFTTLDCDSRYFELLGSDHTKLSFFKTFTAWMREFVPNFGKACYVDSSPLPNDDTDNPYNALRCGNNGDCSAQMRLALVLDDATNLPVWYELIQGNQMDSRNLNYIMQDTLTTLGIDITSVVLDAGYVSQKLIEEYGSGTEKTMIARMPNRKGYPYKELYRECRNSFMQPKYKVFHDGRIYFGKQKEIELFGQQIYAYVMLDRIRALQSYTHQLAEHADKFNDITYARERWLSDQGGFFILISNIDATPAEILADYIGRVHVELMFKTNKSFEGLMPLAKWTPQTIKGKLLQDIIDSIIRVWMRRSLPEYKKALMDLFHRAGATGSTLVDDKYLRIETATKQVRQAYAQFDEKLPGFIQLDDWRKQLLLAQ